MADVQHVSWRQRWLEPEKVAVLPRTLSLAVLGAVVAWFAGLPAAHLSGSTLAVACAALFGIRVGMPRVVREAALVLLGTEIGTQLRLHTLTELASVPTAILGLMIVVPAIMLSVSWVLRVGFGFDEPTARLAAVPGALPFVLATAETTPADALKVAVVQLLRLLAIAALMPLILSTVGGTPTVVAKSHADAIIPMAVLIRDLVVAVAASLLVTMLFYRLRWPAPPLFGAMVGAGFVAASGLSAPVFPPALAIGISIVIGASTGAAFAGRPARDVFKALPAGLSGLAVGSLVALAGALIVGRAIGHPVAEVWLAYAPGGAETMGIIALTLGYDAAFIGVLSVVRFLGLGVIVPLWVRRFVVKP